MDVVTRAEAVASGLTGAEVDRRLRDGSWEPLRRGVYARCPTTNRTVVEAAAAIRVLGGDVVVSHETAARLQGIPLLDEPTTVSVTRTGGSTRRLSRLRVKWPRCRPTTSVRWVS